jgi:UMF1 family MFS transporter
MMSPLYSKKSIIAWCIYDWGNSAFPTIILTFVFAAYFTGKVAINKIIGTAQWADAVAIAGLIIALSSPLLGAVADNEGRRKPWIAIFATLVIISAALLWFAKPSSNYVIWTLIWMGLGLVGVEMAQVFYNAMLRDLAPKNYIGRISGWGWGTGYFGGLCSLIVALFLFVKNGANIGLNTTTYEHIRICGPFVSIWFFVFALPFFILTPDRPSTGISYITALRQGLRQFFQTLRALSTYKQILKFLLARMIYIDGLNTIFAFGGIYAAGTFNMSFAQVVEFGISMNVAAGIGAMSFAWLDDYLGSKPTILISLIIMLATGIGMLTTHSQIAFWILGMGLSLCVGPVQAASRSLLVHIAPAHMVTEMFGLFAFSGKATSFIGPWLVGTFTLLFNSQRVGMSVVMFFFFIGGALLSTVKITK